MGLSQHAEHTRFENLFARRAAIVDNSHALPPVDHIPNLRVAGPIAWGSMHARTDKVWLRTACRSPVLYGRCMIIHCDHEARHSHCHSTHRDGCAEPDALGTHQRWGCVVVDATGVPLGISRPAHFVSGSGREVVAIARVRGLECSVSVVLGVETPSFHLFLATGHGAHAYASCVMRRVEHEAWRNCLACSTTGKPYLCETVGGARVVRPSVAQILPRRSGDRRYDDKAGPIPPATLA